MDTDLLIIFGTIFAIVTCSQLIGLAKKWIERKNSSLDEGKFDRLAKAFIQHKKSMEQRVENLETIVTDEEPSTPAKSSSDRQLDNSHETIEIDQSQDRNQKNSNNSSSLQNMLNKNEASS